MKKNFEVTYVSDSSDSECSRDSSIGEKESWDYGYYLSNMIECLYSAIAAGEAKEKALSSLKASLDSAENEGFKIQGFLEDYLRAHYSEEDGAEDCIRELLAKKVQSVKEGKLRKERENTVLGHSFGKEHETCSSPGRGTLVGMSMLTPNIGYNARTSDFSTPEQPGKVIAEGAGAIRVEDDSGYISPSADVLMGEDLGPSSASDPHTPEASIVSAKGAEVAGSYTGVSPMGVAADIKSKESGLVNVPPEKADHRMPSLDRRYKRNRQESHEMISDHNEVEGRIDKVQKLNFNKFMGFQ